MARQIDDERAALLDFVELEATSLVQAMRMAAASNETQAAALDAEGSTLASQIMRSSVASWDAKAGALSRLVHALPDDEG